MEEIFQWSQFKFAVVLRFCSHNNEQSFKTFGIVVKAHLAIITRNFYNVLFMIFARWIDRYFAVIVAWKKAFMKIHSLVVFIQIVQFLRGRNHCLFFGLITQWNFDGFVQQISICWKITTDLSRNNEFRYSPDSEIITFINYRVTGPIQIPNSLQYRVVQLLLLRVEIYRKFFSTSINIKSCL